jgi:hypothetical protein
LAFEIAKKRRGEAREEHMIIDFVSYSPGLKNPLEFMTEPNIQPPPPRLDVLF